MKLSTQLCCTIIAISISAAAEAGGDWSRGSSATAQATVGAQVLSPFVVSGSDTSLLLAPNASEWLGSRISTTAQPLQLNSSDSSSTTLNINGEPDTTFGISLPGENLIRINNGIQALLLNGSLSTDLTTGLLDELGHHRLTINADFSLLDMVNLQGLFSGYFPVTVEHN